MNTKTRRALLALPLALAALPLGAETAETIDTRVNLALDQLLATVQGARELLADSRGVLVMPNIVKGGLILGGAYGEGALRVNGDTVGYYSLAAGSLGWQIGVQSTKQAVFFMTDAALAQFRASDGWALSADAEITVPGDGLAVGLSTTSARPPVVAVTFGQDGALIGASIAGAKYSPIVR